MFLYDCLLVGESNCIRDEILFFYKVKFFVWKIVLLIGNEGWESCFIMCLEVWMILVGIECIR